MNAFPKTSTIVAANEQAKQFATGETRTELMFGIQYDLILRHMERRGAKTKSELKTKSGSWANYKDQTFTVERGLYFQYGANLSTEWNKVAGFTKAKSAPVLYTTGATDRHLAMGIYDLAGNLY